MMEENNSGNKDNDPARDWDESVSGITDVTGADPPLESSHTKPTDAGAAGSSDVSTYEMIPGPTILPDATTAPVLPCYLMKGQQRNQNFCARQNILGRLDEVLVQHVAKETMAFSGPSIFALCGFGGIGKTQIAVEFAYSRMHEYDAVFWVQADDSAKLAKDFGDIAKALGLEKVSGDQIISKELVLSWLSRPTRESSSTAGKPKWLLIFDNADDLSVIVDYIPVSSSGSILITSRDPLAKTQTHFRTTEGIDLDILSAVDAGSLLRKLTGYNRDEEDIKLSETISERLSGVPLAIAQIAATVVRRDLSLDEFLDLYENDSNRPEFYRSTDGNILTPEGTHKTIFAVWALEDLGDNAACLLDLMAFMDPDQIPESIYTKFTGVNAEKDLQIHVSSFPSDPLAYVNARTELSRSSLVKRNVSLKEVSLHRLIQDAVRARMTPERILAVFKSSISLLYSAWPFGKFDHSNARHPACEKIFPHIRNLQHQYQNSTTLKRTLVSNYQFARLLMDAGWYQIERGRAFECWPLQQLALRLCGTDTPDHQTSLLLAEIHFCSSEVGLLTSSPSMILEHARKGLRILKSCNDQTWRTPLLNKNMALGNIMIRQWDVAAEHADISINGFLALEEEVHYPNFAIVNKGYALQLKGTVESLEEAATLLTDHQKYRRDRFGDMDSGAFTTGLSMLTLGDVRNSQGRWDEGLELHEKTLQQYLSSLGPKHQRTAAVYIKLSDHYVRLGAYEKSKNYLEIALEVFADRATFEIEITRATFKLAKVHSLLGDEKSATACRDKASRLLVQIGVKQKRKLTEDDVDDLLAFWSK